MPRAELGWPFGSVMKLRIPHLRGVLLGSLALGLLGCGDDERNPGVAGGGTGPGPLPRACLVPAEGCPCTSDEPVKCGETVSRKGDMVTCRVGERSCVDGEWGECVGTDTTEMFAAPRLPGVRPLALATSSASCMEVCEPYCQELADTPDGITVGSDLDVDPGGITLHTDGFTGGNCPDLDVTPDAVTLEITQIN